jgi:hypothetical protein
MAKMNSGFQQLLHGDGGHRFFLLGFSSTPLSPVVDPRKPDTQDRSGSVRFLKTLYYTNLYNDGKLKKSSPSEKIGSE